MAGVKNSVKGFFKNTAKPILTKITKAGDEKDLIEVKDLASNIPSSRVMPSIPDTAESKTRQHAGLRPKVKATIAKAKAGLHVKNKLRKKRLQDQTTKAWKAKNVADTAADSALRVSIKNPKREGRIMTILPELSLDHNDAWDNIFTSSLEEARNSPGVEDEDFVIEHFGEPGIPSIQQRLSSRSLDDFHPERLSTIPEALSDSSPYSLRTVIHHPLPAAVPQPDDYSESDYSTSDYEAELTTTIVSGNRTKFPDIYSGANMGPPDPVDVEQIRDITAMAGHPALRRRPASGGDPNLALSPIYTVYARNDEVPVPRGEVLSMSKVTVVYEVIEKVPVPAEPALSFSSVITVFESNDETLLALGQKKAPTSQHQALALSKLVPDALRTPPAKGNAPNSSIRSSGTVTTKTAQSPETPPSLSESQQTDDSPPSVDTQSAISPMPMPKCRSAQAPPRSSSETQFLELTPTSSPRGPGVVPSSSPSPSSRSGSRGAVGPSDIDFSKVAEIKFFEHSPTQDGDEGEEGPGPSADLGGQRRGPVKRCRSLLPRPVPRK
ncbi:uncharacterized protein E0L32_006873 [Thyridium curvatum]|uniref:Uncharacterized protein n=1 Tax=Thyridium curvatum TaxID=1093900 RepID=A0A507B607_9PEZI|nr:uncharacterized protein E0L32_006873 [Thyridium curvatum]TPX12461.1 hypothetical protein E0L32_006873 [Thyridium curvatum]